ncbi:DUF2935 domain-containing protein [Paenibacillus doosanensis]|uniref:DUF2935 domain-containing protein n=1 Tax=Paenibacillus TaxID=44249 RepID=UPI00201E078A|nr:MULTISPECIES: DUF2935 domain-containing protein [Paenibacillus]MCS7462266.1 DUF2935 domain-containing protein [Paenibacillus doosanensis]
MEPSAYVSSASFEHPFWLQVCGDHARFIRDALAPSEEEEIGRAVCFIRTFDALLNDSRRPLNGASWVQLSEAAFRRVQELRAFKLHLLERSLDGRVVISLPPTFINHMVNEAEEYIRVLAFLRIGEPAPVFDEIHHHLVWLADAAGHAGSIAADLDMTERRLLELSRTFETHFTDFYLKAIEVAGYMRTRLKQFPALARFQKEVELEMALFREFLRELEELALSKEVLGTLSPLMPDHMAREECYYLIKLASLSNTRPPNCDPAKPRVEG